ncbi:MAG: hypothetical protein NTX25_07820 [Proteobacteria bacterium]|nr:hypothetical protein [Pseudomonadota bacterium]
MSRFWPNCRLRVAWLENIDQGIVDEAQKANRGEFILSQKPLVDAAFGHANPRIPIWFLRQAGRYLPEYMKIRKNVEFVELCRNPQLASEVTLQPLRRYDVDAAIIFSDILIPCTAMGQELSFEMPLH